MASTRRDLTLLERAREESRGHEGNSLWNWSNLDPERSTDSAEYLSESRQDLPIVIDCWKYNNGVKFSECVEYIKEEDINTWVEQKPQEHEQPCAGLRLIHKFHSTISKRLPFDKYTVDAINDKFNLPDVMSHTATLITGACGKFMSADSRSVVFVCRRIFARHTASTVVRHDFESETTVGYLLSDEMLEIHHCLLAIPRQFKIMSHPLLVPILIGDQMLEAATQSLQTVDDRVMEIEDGTGFNNYEDIESDYNTIGYRELSRDLGEVASMFAHLRSRILAIKTLYEFFSRELKSCQSWIPTGKWDHYSNSTRILTERVEYGASHIEHLLVFRGIEMRLQVQQNVIFNLIAQEDNLANIQLSKEMKGIAIKTKRDGSIMKTIAFLGTFFLPATFVSTLFAMPLFDWEAPTMGGIIGNHFWIYCAVTGPLTLATMLIVGYWILSRTGKNSKDNLSPHDHPKPSKLMRLKGMIGLRKRRKFSEDAA